MWRDAVLWCCGVAARHDAANLLLFKRTRPLSHVAVPAILNGIVRAPVPFSHTHTNLGLFLGEKTEKEKEKEKEKNKNKKTK